MLWEEKSHNYTVSEEVLDAANAAQLTGRKDEVSTTYLGNHDTWPETGTSKALAGKC